MSRSIMHVPSSSFKKYEAGAAGNGGGGASAADGVLGGLACSVTGNDVAVTAGSWRIAGQVYLTGSTTTLVLGAADVSDNRIDLIYADTNNQVLLLAGVASANPVKPAVPDNCVEVGFALVTPTGNSVGGVSLAGYVTQTDFDDTIGNKADLVTNDKSNIVAAVNEVSETLSGLEQDNVILKIFKKSNYS